MHSNADSFSLLLHRITFKALELLDAEDVILFLKDAKKKKYLIAYAATRAGQPFTPNAELFDFAAAEKCIRYRKWVETERLGADVSRSCLWIPLCVENDILGLLYLIDCLPLPFQRSLTEQVHAFTETSAKALYKRQTHLGNAADQSAPAHRPAKQPEILRQTKGNAAAKIGHEINNFIAAVNANLELALDLLNNDGKADEIQQRILKAQQLLLGITPLTGGLMAGCAAEPAFELTNLNKLVQDFIASVEPLYQRKGARFCCHLQPDLPLLKLDSRLLNQTLFNLCKNAVEARPDAQIVISTQLDRCGKTVLLTIKDNGPGFSVEKLRRLFAETFTDKANGHGLGLSICREIVEKHGGSIEAGNNRSGGACFSIRLPLPQQKEYGVLEFDRIERLCKPSSSEKLQSPLSLVTFPPEQTN